MFLFRVKILLLLLFTFTSGCKGGNGFDFSKGELMVVSNGDRKSTVKADYLFEQLSKRNTNREKFEVLRSDSDVEYFKGNIVYLEIVEDLASDYRIVNEPGKLSLFGKSENILKWLSYQLVDHLAEFHELQVDDLPPSYINFDTHEFSFAMKYREPHLLPNTILGYPEVNLTNSIDRDWGLWGHNFRKVFQGEVPQGSMALVEGKRTGDQFCFSSDETFYSMKSFVEANYGRERREGKWFMVSPNDNDMVCTCKLCRKQGNTENDASPALAAFLNRMSSEFRKDQFFMTAYRTTRSARAVHLKDNVGVFLSTVDLPKKCILDSNSEKVKTFFEKLKEWKAKTSNIYLWDYISNFDDYLTPYPVLERIRSQIALFRSLGVNGMFLNGSGYDYSPFDDVKSYVIGALMIDPNLKVQDLVRGFHDRFYPVTGNILSGYLLEMEENAFRQNFETGMYVPFRSAIHSYFQEDSFLRLYSEIERLMPEIKGEERRKIEKLLIGLSYPKLQVIYHSAQNRIFQDGTATDRVLSTLKQHVKFGDMKNYKEDEGLLENYVAEWNSLKNFPPIKGGIHDVKALGMVSGNSLDEAFLLNDGIKGFPSDFNQGWLLSGEDMEVSCVLGGTKGKTLRIGFLINEKHRMLPPERIEILQNKEIIASAVQTDMIRIGNTLLLEKPIGDHLNKSFQIRIFKNVKVKNSVIACDEIFLQ